VSDDIVARSDQLDQEILAIPKDRVFTKRVVVVGFCVLLAPLLVTLGLVIGITLDTNRAVARQVTPLQNRVLELEETNAAQESIIGQQTDAILLLIGTLKDNGITPPEIVIRAPDE
jgi:hypothetical protein